MIWEHTWPAPRLIENVFYAEFDSSDEEVYAILHPTGSLSVALEEEGLFKKCPEPVALQVCQESRRHTRTKYMHAHTLAGSFYFSPSRDMLYLPLGFEDEDTDL